MNMSVLLVGVLALLMWAAPCEAFCNYCAYASLCDRCKGCPCTHDDTCKFCQYCPLCTFAESACSTYCSEGSILRTITEYVGKAVTDIAAITGYDALATVDPKEVDLMLEKYLAEPGKYGKAVFDARIKDRKLRKDIEHNTKEGKIPKVETTKTEL